MKLSLMNDDDILNELADRIDLMRRAKELSDDELVKKGGSNISTLKRFRAHKGGISLLNFIRLLRGLGELDRLDELLILNLGYSPAKEAAIQSIEHLPKRIRKKKSRSQNIKWGDET